VFKSPKTVQYEGLFGSVFGSFLLVEQETVASEVLRESLNGAVGDTGLSGDLS
jgi:hypothetical protein